MSKPCTYLGPDYDPRTDPGARLRPVCCRPAVPLRSYCDLHVDIVYQKGTALGRRKKDAQRARAVWDVESEFNAALEELELEGEV